MTRMESNSPLRLEAAVERWPLRRPFRITGYVWEAIEVAVVRLQEGEWVGRGEAAGIYYKGDTPASIVRRVEALRGRIEAGLDRLELQELIPPGGARNALDCALWDLEAKRTRQSAWQLAGLTAPHPLVTTFTCGADEPRKMAQLASSYIGAKALKLKLTGEPLDADRVRAVREARPDVWLGVDANQGFERPFLEWLMPTLVEARVELIEQPFPVGSEALVDGLQSPIPLAADESVQSLGDVPDIAERFDVINIKLDKCGGLTEALAMAHKARQLGRQVMVGNMMGTALAMAPAFLVGQLCKVVDLDGPVLLKEDRPNGVEYTDGSISCPEGLWGHP
jgi:L-Ala-D/L-Glu epimerase